MSFTERLASMRGLYLETERQFVEFGQVIPYERNPEGIYSPRLVNILQSTGPQVDGMFKILEAELGLPPASDKFPSHYDTLNAKGLLEIQKVTPQRVKRPFKPFEARSPDWWQAYNDTKHDLPNGVYRGTLEKVIRALGGVVVLHHIGQLLFFRHLAKTGISQHPDFLAEVVDSKNWHDIELAFMRDPDDENGIRFAHGGGIPPISIGRMKPLSVAEMDLTSQVFYFLTFYPRMFGDVKILP